MFRLLLCFWALFSLTSCVKETCQRTVTHTVQVPVYLDYSVLRAPVQSQPAQALKKPGKIYFYQNYLLINERDKGIHVYYNGNPRDPQAVSFIPLPGNTDFSIRNQILYANSYTDLWVLDFSDPTQVQVHTRLDDVFLFGQALPINHQETFLVGYRTEEVTENAPCESSQGGFSFFGSQQEDIAVNEMPVGSAGSMAAFRLRDSFLYTLHPATNTLQVYAIHDAKTPPTQVHKMTMPPVAETLFPYKDKLFVGSQSGMYIYDLQQPSIPRYLGGYAHMTACDPVVVQDDLAYVTLRSGNTCLNSSNQLDIIDISNPTAPLLLHSAPMENPHGLAIDNETLYLCDGAAGLKVFDAQIPTQIENNLRFASDTHEAYDVILAPNAPILFLIGSDGLAIYSRQNPENLELLSRIDIQK